MSIRTELDVQSEAALRHGVFLQDAATGLYVSEGLTPEHRLQLLDGTTSYSGLVGRDFHVGIGERVQDASRNFLKRVMGEKGIYGLSMYIGVDDLTQGIHAFYTHRDRFSTLHGGRYRTFETSVFEPTGEVENGIAENRIVEDPELALQFCHDLQNLGPDNIVVERRHELSDVEKDEMFGNLLESCKKMADANGLVLDEMEQGHQRLIFKLPHDIEVNIGYTPRATINIATGEPTASPNMNIWFKSVGQAPYAAHLMGLEMPWGKRTTRDVNAYTYPEGDANQSRQIRHDDIEMLVGVVGKLADEANKGRVEATGNNDYMFSQLERARQPEVDVSEEQITRILDILQGN